MKDYPTSVKEMLALDDVPVVQINQEGIFIFINSAFTAEYGWTKEDLMGQSVTVIMPAHMKSAHNVGFSRFLTTEKSSLLGKPLPLKVHYKDGQELVSNHIIIGDKAEGRWTFTAIVDYPQTRG